MKDFGIRLKEERERLGLSQAKFAEACGVGKTAQYTYEKGDRDPSMSYMDAAEKVGVDTTYVFSGTRKGEDWDYARAFRRMLYTIEMMLGLAENKLEDISLLYVEEEKRLGATGSADFNPYNNAMLAWLKTSSKPDRLLDLDLFTSIFAMVEAATVNLNKTLPPEKKNKVTVMLYRSFHTSGKVDQRMIEEAVQLAAG